MIITLLNNDDRNTLPVDFYKYLHYTASRFLLLRARPPARAVRATRFVTQNHEISFHLSFIDSQKSKHTIHNTSIPPSHSQSVT